MLDKSFLNSTNSSSITRNTTDATTVKLCHPPDGSTSPKYKLLCFITAKLFYKEKNALAFNRDRCCHLVLCLQLIPFYYRTIFRPSTLPQNQLKLKLNSTFLVRLIYHKEQVLFVYCGSHPIS